MATDPEHPHYRSAREKFLGLSLESTRKSYYPQLREQLDASRENEQRLQLLIDSLPALISYVTVDQRFALVNRQYETLFRQSRNKIVGKTVRNLLGDDNYARMRPHIETVLAGDPAYFESSLALPDSREIWLESSYIPLFDKTGRVDGFYTLCRDLTEKKHAAEERARLEEKLREADKFKAIGTLAGGIAHDFNNLLMGIQGRASLLAIDMKTTDPLQEHVRAIEEYVRSAANLTKQLLGLARGGKYETKPIGLNDLVAKTAAMFGRTRKELIIHNTRHPASPVIEADRSQLEQVLLNMLVNAWHAMPDGGEIYLDTAVVALNGALSVAHDLAPGRFARISITDTGCGMDEATRQQVFNPFFTTKDKQRGTGLGLASAYGIVKNHGGTITVYSEVGHGTTFNVYLPLSDKAESPEPTESAASLHRGTGSILLVDDETIILDVGKAMLEALGYQPITAHGGRQALELLEQPQAAIDLVIVDLIMPGMDGGKVFDAIRDRHPDLPVILASGYSLNGQASAIMARGCDGFIQKPFDMQELSRVIRSILIGPRHLPSTAP